MHVDWIEEAVYELAGRYKADCLIGLASGFASPPSTSSVSPPIY